VQHASKGREVTISKRNSHFAGDPIIVASGAIESAETRQKCRVAAKIPDENRLENQESSELAAK
jgi:hypothetical protein